MKEIEMGDGPLWKCSWDDTRSESGIKSCVMFWTSVEALAEYERRAAEPTLCINVQVSWPHFAGDHIPEGAISVGDLDERQRAELDLLLAGKGTH